MPPLPTLRIARPTDRLPALAAMYRQALNLTILASFENHEGFDGIILGHPNSPYHLEFTTHRGHPTPQASPSPDHLLVFYIPDIDEWTQTCNQMLAAGFTPVNSYNPYWDKAGRTFEDLDGHRIVLQNAAWPH